eukprot:scaffold104323_cov61-Attheya_sp.AAC.1
MVIRNWSCLRMWPDQSTGNNLFERGKYLCPVQDYVTEVMPASWIQSGIPLHSDKATNQCGSPPGLKEGSARCTTMYVIQYSGVVGINLGACARGPRFDSWHHYLSL